MTFLSLKDFGCEINYCRNGGQCIMAEAVMKCLCSSGYTGQYCQYEGNSIIAVYYELKITHQKHCLF